MTTRTAELSREERLDEIIASYLDERARGRLPDRQELLARDPDLADELEVFFADQDRFERLASPLREVVRSPLGLAAVRDVLDSVAPDEAFPETLTLPAATPGPRQWGSVSAPFGYELLEEVGHGGMGVVYKARQKSLKRLVALKMMRAGAHAQPEETARFLAEAEAVARLKHPHVVQIHEVGTHNDQPYFCLELVEGGSLHKRLAGTPLAPRPAAALVETVARAVHHAHEHGIVHRDLKPGNILLAGEPDAAVEQCIPKVTDFGLARRLDDESLRTRSGEIVGTPCYMAPEQASGQSKTAGPAADVYSLGAVLYECLTGRPPFNAANVVDTVLRVLYDDPLPPTRLQPTCPRDLETICLKCLEKEPHRRYASADNLAEDLRAYLDGRPIAARPASRWERSVKWVRRHPAVAALVAVVALIPTAAIVGHTIDLRQKVTKAVAEAEQANAEKQDAEQVARLAVERAEQAEVRGECQPLLEQARQARARKDLATAGALIGKVQAATARYPALADLRAEADRLADQVHRLEKLFQGRDEALFHLHHKTFTGLEAPESLAKARTTAREALALFGVREDADVGPVLAAGYSPDERDRVRQSSYELLLILAEATAHPEREQDLTRALAILDRARRLVRTARSYHQLRARYLDWLGEKGEARVELTTAEALQPVSPLDAFLVGTTKWLEPGAQAQDYFARAVREAPDFSWARFFLAVSWLQSEKSVQAQADLTVFVGQRPDFVWGHVILGHVHAGVGAFANAEAAYVRAEELNRTAQDPSVRYVLHNNRGVLRIRQHRYDEAVDELQQAIALLPRQSLAYLNLGVAQRDQAERDEALRQMTARLARPWPAAVALAVPNPHRYDEALHQLGEAIHYRPGLALLYRQRAETYLKRNHRDDAKAALADFLKALDCEKGGGRDSHRDHVDCGWIRYYQGEYRQALEHGEAASDLQPGYAPAYRLRGQSLLKLKKPAEALEAFDLYLDYGNPVADVFHFRAEARTRLDDHQGAVNEYSSALAMWPRDSALHAARGWAYLRLDFPRSAAIDFARAIELDPRNAHAHSGRSFALVELGQVAEGAAHARKAVALSPTTPRRNYLAARVLAVAAAREARAGRSGERYRDEAVEYLDRELRLLRDEQERVKFWADHVRTENRPGRALVGLRYHPRFVALAERYDRPVER